MAISINDKFTNELFDIADDNAVLSVDVDNNLSNIEMTIFDVTLHCYIEHSGTERYNRHHSNSNIQDKVTY